MTRLGILGATALSLSLAIAAPAGAQERGRTGAAHVNAGAGMRASGGNIGGAPQANFRAAPTAQANVGGGQFGGRMNAQVAPRGTAQFAQPQPGRGGEFRAGREAGFRGGRDRGFGRDAAIAAGVAAGGALAYGTYGYGYDPYVYGDSYAYDDSAYYDPGFAVAYDATPAPVVEEAVGIGGAGYCAQRFRSYDPVSGTYLGFDGLRHPCP